MSFYGNAKTIMFLCLVIILTNACSCRNNPPNDYLYLWECKIYYIINLIIDINDCMEEKFEDIPEG